MTSAVAVGTGSSVSGVAGARGSIGARELLEPDGGAASGGVGVGLSGCGVNTSEIGGLSDGGIGAALGGGRVGENDYSGGVDELISGMSKLLVPRHLRCGNSGRQGEPIT